MKNKNTVFVGLSGGVDSSVAALRLQKQGFEVVGVFIKVWHPDFMVCNWEQERLDAMRVAAHLGIPFLTCDAEVEYRDEVAKYFISEYKAGRTPNPDVMCNKQIKFGAFIRFAKEHGADYIATGHYAQRKKVNNLTELHRGIDTNKDQTYFLWTLTKEQLNYSLFPVGSSTKKVIRNEAKVAKIPVAEKQDSQGICFLGHVDIPEFLSHYVNLVPGKVLDTDGKEIGVHKGALVYTLGQRHGFTLSTSNTNQVPHYVVEKVMDKNVLVVAKEPAHINQSENILLTQSELRSKIGNESRVEVQFRYRQKPIPATYKNISVGRSSITLINETETPSAGQSCVIYEGSHCVGGGIVS